MTQWILTSCLLILAVVLIRTVGRDKISARMRYAMWGLVLVRLLMPFSIGESVLSVENFLPKETHVEQLQTEPALMGEMIEMQETDPSIEMPMIPIDDAGTSRTIVNAPVVLWALGSIITALIFMVSNLRFASQLRRSRQKIMHRFIPIYVTEAVEMPCLFGVWKPAIYITDDVLESETALRHVLAHELTHYRHKDHIWSVLRCVCVSLHWYNPLVWMAAVLSQKDAELACDEGTILQLGGHERTDYAKTLVELTCVGYKGILTAATSMTGSDSDLKTHIKRIAKNPEMTVAAAIIVLLIVGVVGAAVFTGAISPKIEGLWQKELSYLGVGVDDPANGYMEYDFYDGRGIRTTHMGGELRSAEWFTYIVDGDTLELWFDGTNDIQTFTFTVTDDILQLNQRGRVQTMICLEQKELPFLPEGDRDIMEIHNDMNEENLQLTDVQSAQLLHLLRSGEITVIQDYAKNGVKIERCSYTVFTGQCRFCIADGVIFGTRNENTDGYLLSNIDEIEYWLETLAWSGNEISNMQPVEGEVIGTNADVGDVVRILDDVMEPAYLSIDGLKTMQSLLWLGLDDAIGTEEVAWDEVYYSILNSDLPSKEGVVFLSDNGSLYMDGVRYELSTADALLEHLDAVFNEFRITQRGQPIIAVHEAVGSTVYLELRGTPGRCRGCLEK